MSITLNRLFIFTRNDIITQKKSIIFGSIAIFGGVLVSFILTAIGGGGASYHAAMYRNILLIGGYIIASTAFADIHKKPQGLHYLTLPGSTGERLLSRLFLVSIAYPVLLTILYSLTTIAGSLIAEPIFGNSPGVFIPGTTLNESGVHLLSVSPDRNGIAMTAGDFWKTLGVLVSVQAVFLFGSIYFKKAAFLKVAVSSFIIMVLLGAFLALLARLVFYGDIYEMGELINSMNTDPDLFIRKFTEKDFSSFNHLLDVFNVIWDYMFYLVTPLFFWTLSFIRLRETEV